MTLEERITALENKVFPSGEMAEIEKPISRSQLEFPLDKVTDSTLKIFLKDNIDIRFFRKRMIHSDLGGIGTTKDTNLFILPANSEILSAWFNITTAFAHASTYTISIGPDGTETTLQTAQNAKTTGLKLVVGTDFTTNRAVYSSTADTTIQARATVGAGNVSASTAGVVEFNFVYVIHKIPV